MYISILIYIQDVTVYQYNNIEVKEMKSRLLLLLLCSSTTTTPKKAYTCCYREERATNAVFLIQRPIYRKLEARSRTLVSGT